MAESTQTVQLQLPLLWRLWRGYICHRFREDGTVEVHQSYANPMDLESWTDLGSKDLGFPNLKPNFEVFGVPSRSRRQRGWYQVKPPDSDDINPVSGPTVMYATATDLPPELIHQIVSVVANVSPHDPNYKVNGHQHTLALCGQVCRHWAKVCQKALFEHILLRSRSDMIQLKEFVLAQESSIRHHLRRVDLIDRLIPSGTPWIHDARRILVDLPSDIPLKVVLTGPIPASSRPLRTVNRDLPRSLPMMTQTISVLVLRDIHFRGLSDLLHLVDEMHSLKDFWGEKLTWPLEQTDRTTAQVITRRRRRTQPQNWHLVECTQVSLACYGLLHHCGVDHAKHRCVSPEDTRAILTIAQHLEHDTKRSTRYCQLRLEHNPNTIAVQFGSKLYGDPQSWQCEFRNTSIGLMMDIKTSQGSDNRTKSCIARAVILPGSLWKDIDWTAFDATTSVLPHLEDLTVHAEDVGKAKHLKETLSERLPIAVYTGKLKFQGAGPRGYSDSIVV